MKKILLVDDEPHFCRLMKKNLEAAGGFQVITCDDPKAALGLAREMRPELVLLDVLMPEMSGMEVAEQLRADEQTRSIPVIYVTAILPPLQVNRKGNEIGGRYVVAKPIAVKELLRVIEMAARGERPAEPPSEPPVPPKRKLGKTKVLIIDDEEKFGALLKANLEQMGDREVFFITDPRAGLKWAKKHSPHIILMDVLMPGMSGLEALKRLKADPKTCTIPVLMLTALMDEETRKEACRSYNDDYIEKPVNTEALNLKIDSVLARIGKK